MWLVEATQAVPSLEILVTSSQIEGPPSKWKGFLCERVMERSVMLPCVSCLLPKTGRGKMLLETKAARRTNRNPDRLPKIPCARLREEVGAALAAPVGQALVAWV